MENKERIEQSIPKLIADAVTKAISHIEKLYQEISEKYHRLKDQFEKLYSRYSRLELEHLELRQEYDSISDKAEKLNVHEKDRELMYAILDNNNLSHVYDKCKSEEIEGYHFFRNMEMAKFKSRHQKTNKKMNEVNRERSR